jgi:hypothetical protein
MKKGGSEFRKTEFPPYDGTERCAEGIPVFEMHCRHIFALQHNLKIH